MTDKQTLSSFVIDEQIRNLPLEAYDSKQLEKWTTNLQQLVLYNRLILFCAKKLSDYQKSGFQIISEIMSFILLILFTILSFALINYGLYKIDYGNFNYVIEPTFFTFFYYSFENSMFNQISEIVPLKQTAILIYMFQNFFALLWGLILVTLFVQYKKEQKVLALNKVIENIEKQGKELESFIAEQYNLDSIEVAMDKLTEMKSALVNFIYQISKNT